MFILGIDNATCCLDIQMGIEPNSRIVVICPCNDVTPHCGSADLEDVSNDLFFKASCYSTTLDEKLINDWNLP